MKSSVGSPTYAAYVERSGRSGTEALVDFSFTRSDLKQGV